MYKRIKQLADEAIALQNKNRMDEVLREISGLAMQGSMLTMFEDARIAKWGSEPCPECLKPRACSAPTDQDTLVINGITGLPVEQPDLAAKLDAANPGEVVLPAGDETKVAPGPDTQAAYGHPDEPFNAEEYAKTAPRLPKSPGKKGGAK